MFFPLVKSFCSFVVGASLVMVATLVMGASLVLGATLVVGVTLAMGVRVAYARRFAPCPPIQRSDVLIDGFLKHELWCKFLLSNFVDSLLIPYRAECIL